MDLLENALEALLVSKDKCEILDSSEYEKYLNHFFVTFPFTSWGTIDWNIIIEKTKIKDLSQILPYLNQHGETIINPIYVIWGEDNLPIIKCNLYDALKNIQLLTRVGTYGTWIYCPMKKWVIEFYHHGEITMGYANDR